MITTLTGENDATRQAEAIRRVQAFVAEYGDMALERLEGDVASYEQLVGAVQSLPFLAARKLIVLRAPGLNKDFISQFEMFAKSIAETNDVLIIEPKLDKRLSYYKQLKKLTEFHEFPVLDSQGVVSFAVSYAKEQGGEMTMAEGRLLVERVGTNQLIVQHEVEKLLAYDTHITKTSTELLTERTPQSSIFDLMDAAFAGDGAKAARLYLEQRAQQVEPQIILAMMVRQLYTLALLKAANGRTVDEIARSSGMSPYPIRKASSAVQRVPYARLKDLITILLDIDLRTKSEPLNLDDALQYYLVELAH